MLGRRVRNTGLEDLLGVIARRAWEAGWGDLLGGIARRAWKTCVLKTLLGDLLGRLASRNGTKYNAHIFFSPSHQSMQAHTLSKPNLESESPLALSLHPLDNLCRLARSLYRGVPSQGQVFLAGVTREPPFCLGGICPIKLHGDMLVSMSLSTWAQTISPFTQAWRIAPSELYIVPLATSRYAKIFAAVDRFTRNAAVE